MKILGINAAFHDSAACLLVDGVPVAAAEEERFTRVKHHKRARPFNSYALPYHALDYCLRAGGLRLGEVDHVAYSFDPFPLVQRAGVQSFALPTSAAQASQRRTFDPWQTIFLAGTTEAVRGLLEDVPWHLQERIGRPEHHGWQFHFVPHHHAHAASAFLASPHERAAVLTVDGYGGDATTAYFLGEGTQLTPLSQVEFPHSLGLLYELTTNYLGFLASSDEYKVMAMAAYGKPTYLDVFRQLITLGAGGDYRIAGPLVLGARCGPERRRGEPIEQRHFDVACSLQTALEETVLHLARWLQRESQADALCFAGGVALNCVLNQKLRHSGLFREVWVPPAAGDAGTALGAALLIDAQHNPAARRAYQMEHAYLGPGYDDAEIEAFLQQARVAYRKLDDVPITVARWLAAQRVVGWFQGRMEFGARALGARSLLASPCDAAMRERLNEVKGREQFRPVAPIVPLEEAARWFELAAPVPFMTFVEKVRPERLAQIPAVAHVDATARLQTVERRHQPLLHALLLAHQRLTGIPVLVNTSFNVREEPIVCSLKDAVATFYTSPLDELVIGSYQVLKPECME
jgi:carbamoyltransferase